jgi:1-acyl-sn-glycerol-3-phosphate acyltransferase
MNGEPGPLYAVVRALASLALRSWFRLRVAGADRVPGEGPAIVARDRRGRRLLRRRR